MKKSLISMVLIMIFCFLSACGSSGSEQAEYTVTYYDGEEVLKEAKVKEGETADEYVPEKEGYRFAGWYGTPSLNREYDFSSGITKDTSIFSGWASENAAKDTREWMLTGESSIAGSLLNSNSWGRLQGDARTPYLLKKKENENVFTLTLDMYANDMFQIADVNEADAAWKEQRGYGYVKDPDDEFIENNASPFAETLETANIKMLMDGNYTIELHTDIENPGLDTIVITRNGDVLEVLETGYIPNISGSITGGNAIETPEQLGDYGFTYLEEDDVYVTQVSLNKGDYFSVLLYLNSWNEVLRTSQVDGEVSDPCYNKEERANITMLESGKYEITLKITPEEEGLGVITIKEIGDFEVKDDHIPVTFHQDDQVVATAYINNGARIPNPGDGEEKSGRIFMGWYQETGGKAPVNFNKPFTTNEKEAALHARYLAEDEEDTRDVYVMGSMNGWAENDSEYMLEQTGDHTYSGTFTFEKDTELLLTLFEGENNTGRVAKGPQVDYDNSASSVEGENNMVVREAGEYRIHYDSYHNLITIVSE